MTLEMAPGEPVMSRDNLDSMKTPTSRAARLRRNSASTSRRASKTIAPMYLTGKSPRSRFNAFRAHGASLDLFFTRDRMKLVIGDKNYSSWSMRPWLLLKHFGIPFDETLIRLGQPDTKATDPRRIRRRARCRA